MLPCEERTSWRDENISRRHREWGIRCRATDLDFLLVEYDKKEPKALIEYKNENAPPQLASKAQYQALIKLGNSAKIPVIACRYKTDFSSFLVVPLNSFAKEIVPRRVELTEAEYVQLLYKMRGLTAPQNVLAVLRSA